MRFGFEVLDGGLLTTVQDRGRVGFAHLGVPRSGALDQGALSAANRLVGNDPGSAGIETTLTGCALRAVGTQVVAITGAFAAPAVDGRPMPWGARIVVPDGGTLIVGPALHGARSLIAVAGGIQTAAVLGSRSRDTLSAIGPEPFRGGDRIAVGVPTGLLDDDPGEVPFRVPSHQVRLLPGPQATWCQPALLASSWRVGSASNRVGVRLEGTPLRRRSGEIRSFAMISGAVQLPPAGLPIILLADHATTGGYPVVAVVDPDDLDSCGQWRPGDRVTLSWR